MQVALNRLGDVGDEDELEATLLGIMRAGPGGLATFIVNLEGSAAPASRHAGVSWDARPTGLGGVDVVACRDSAGRVPPCEMYLDRRGGRFGMAHMAAGGGTADAAMGLLARTTQLSRAWVCPSVLAGIAGGGADPTGGRVRVARGAEGAGSTVRCDGALIPDVDMGVEEHLRLAGEVMAAHSRMCANAESLRLGFVDAAGEARFGGRTIGLVPSRRIEDVQGFIDKVLDGSPPLLMLGGKTRIGDDHYRAPTADLENGEVLGISVSPTRIGVGLHPGCSGSGVLRLLACVQVRHDPGITCRDVTAGVPCG